VARFIGVAQAKTVCRISSILLHTVGHFTRRGAGLNVNPANCGSGEILGYGREFFEKNGGQGFGAW
jgi:hypothetical protein